MHHSLMSSVKSCDPITVHNIMEFRQDDKHKRSMHILHYSLLYGLAPKKIVYACIVELDIFSTMGRIIKWQILRDAGADIDYEVPCRKYAESVVDVFSFCVLVHDFLFA